MFCKLCNYSTTQKSVFQRHCKSKKHLNFKAKSEETSTDTDTDTDENAQVDEVEKKVEEIEKKINTIKKKQIEMEYNGPCQITKFLILFNKCCGDTPSIVALTEKDVIKLLDLKSYKKNMFEKKVLSWSRYNIVHEQVGDIILEKYLSTKEFVNQTSDISKIINRALFKDSAENSDLLWFRDLKNTTFINLIAVPIIDKIKILMCKYRQFNLDLSANEKDEKLKAKYFEIARDVMQYERVSFCDKLQINVLDYVLGKFSPV